MFVPAWWSFKGYIKSRFLLFPYDDYPKHIDTKRFSKTNLSKVIKQHTHNISSMTYLVSSIFRAIVLDRWDIIRQFIPSALSVKQKIFFIKSYLNWINFFIIIGWHVESHLHK
jgi:hypothetical protein